jgi:hypothetical protein
VPALQAQSPEFKSQALFKKKKKTMYSKPVTLKDFQDNEFQIFVLKELTGDWKGK